MEMNLETIDSIAERIVEFSTTHVGDAAVVLALSGDLGAGKTTLVQAIARRLGVQEVPLSPTFVLLKAYETTNPTFTRLVHMDAYRIESEEELAPLKLESVFADPKTLVCVEWPERLGNDLPKQAIRIQLRLKDESGRFIEGGPF